MELDPNNLAELDEKIRQLKSQKKELLEIQKKKLRLKSKNGSSKPNTLNRISVVFRNRLDLINSKREENGFDTLSLPKMTELIVKHKKNWRGIENDLIRYNTSLDVEESEVEFDEK